MSRRTVIGLALAFAVVIGVGYFVLSRRPKPLEPAGTKPPEPAATRPLTAKEIKPPVEKILREWTIPGGDPWASVIFSPTGRFVAYASERSTPRMMYNDWRSQECDTRLGTPYVSPDREHVAFILSRGGKKILVTDGVEGTPCNNLSVLRHEVSRTERYPTRDGQFAYMKQDEENGPWRVVFGGKEGAGYEKIEEVFFSPDMKRLAYGATRGGRSFYVVDGKEFPSFEGYPGSGFWCEFSPDSGRHARLEKRDGQSVVVCDGEESKPFPGIHLIRFSSDGRRMAFVARRGKKNLVVTNGEEGPEADNIQFLSVSPDGSHVAWCARVGTEDLLFVDGKRQAKGAKSCFYAADGRLYWLAKEGEEWFHFWGDQRFPVEKAQKSSSPSWPSFSPNGRHMAYWTAKGERKGGLVLDGKPCAYVPENVIVQWSPDGEHVFYEYGQYGGQTTIGCDDRLASAGSSQTGLVFSPDSRHAAYCATGSSGRYVCIDGFELPEHKGVGALNAGDKLRYTVIEKDGRTARLIEVEWPESRTWEDGFRRSGETAADRESPPKTVEPASPAAAGDPALAGRTVREWRIPKGERPESLQFGRSGDFLSYRLSGEKDTVVFNDKRLNGYDEVSQQTLWYVGDRAAWLASRGGKRMIIVNGVEGKAYAKVKQVPAVSARYTPEDRVVYGAREEGASGWRLVWRGAETPEYDCFLGVRVSEDSSHMAYCGVRGNRVIFVCDGKELPGFEAPAVPRLGAGNDEPIRNPGYGLNDASLSADGSRFAYISRRGKKQFVCCDGKEGPEYDSIRFVQISADGKRLAYVASSGGKPCVVIDGVEQAADDSVRAMVVSPDSQHVAWQTQPLSREGRPLFLDGKEVAPNVEAFWFSPDGRLTWTVVEGEKKFFVWEGQRVPVDVAPYPWPLFSPKGRHVHFTGRDAEGKPRVVVDGRTLERATAIIGWSPDGELMLYAAAEQQGAVSAVWCDDRKASVGTSQRSAAFSPDGRHVAYIALGDGGERVSCDGLAGPTHEQVVSLIPGNTLRYIVWDENKTVARLIEVEWPADRTWKDGFTEPAKPTP